MSLEGLFALPCTARVTTFFLSPCFYQTAPLRARSLLRALSPRSPLGSLGNPSAVFGSHSLEIFLSHPFPGLFPGGRLQPLPVLFRALQPPSFSSRRRVGVPRNLPSHTFLSIFFRKFLRFFSTAVHAMPRIHILNQPIINKIFFCHTHPRLPRFF